MKTIFVLTVLFLDENSEGKRKPIKRQRTWGWFPTLSLGEQAVLANHGDMYEDGYYNAAVLEEIPWGPCARATAEHWYAATYIPSADGGLGAYDVGLFDKPEAIASLVGFGMG